MITIEKHQPETLLLERTRYPIKDMGVGDSFLLDDFRIAESARLPFAAFFPICVCRDAWPLLRDGCACSLSSSI